MAPQDYLDVLQRLQLADLMAQVEDSDEDEGDLLAESRSTEIKDLGGLAARFPYAV
ncbi:MAG: hypothetical protein WA159_03760 [Variovorax sp.]